MKNKPLSTNQILVIKKVFKKHPQKKLLAMQGHISTLMELSHKIGEGSNYSIIQDNLINLM